MTPTMIEGPNGMICVPGLGLAASRETIDAEATSG
jgi:hypothetical protein